MHEEFQKRDLGPAADAHTATGNKNIQTCFVSRESGKEMLTSTNPTSAEPDLSFGK